MHNCVRRLASQNAGITTRQIVYQASFEWKNAILKVIHEAGVAIGNYCQKLNDEVFLYKADLFANTYVSFSYCREMKNSDR